MATRESTTPSSFHKCRPARSPRTQSTRASTNSMSIMPTTRTVLSK